MLYHLSENKLIKMTPRIPNNFMTKYGYEDSSTPRISFAKEIDKAIMGISMKMKGKEMYVYSIDEEKSKPKLKYPNKDQVPDVKITEEVWVLNEIFVKFIGKILILDDAGEPGIPYTYGNNSAELYKWNWQWV